MKVQEIIQFIAYRFSYDESRVRHEESETLKKGFQFFALTISVAALFAVIVLLAANEVIQ
jgi:hypothetical protein